MDIHAGLHILTCSCRVRIMFHFLNLDEDACPTLHDKLPTFEQQHVVKVDPSAQRRAACPNTTIPGAGNSNHQRAMSLEPVHRRSGSSSNIASLCAALARLSIDLNGGWAIRPGTLLDEYERMAIEAQLSRAVLRRSYSEPSPSRIVVLRPPATARREENAEKGEVQARRFLLLEALKRAWCWLSAWGWHGRNGEQPLPMPMPMPQPPAPAPAPAARVCLLDYLR